MTSVGTAGDGARPGWTVHVDVQLRSSVDESTTKVIADALVDVFAVNGAAVSVGRDRVSVTMSRDAGDRDDPATVARAAVADVRRLLARHADVARVVAVEVVADDETDRRLAEPTIPPLVSATDAARMLGVSRQRVHQLIDRPGFPQPVTRPSGGPLWTRMSIEAFARTLERRNGRPPVEVKSSGDAASDTTEDDA